VVRNLLTVVVAIPAFWLAIQVFGWIVSGDIELLKQRVKRDDGAVRFWLSIVLLSLVDCAIFGLALAIFVGAF